MLLPRFAGLFLYRRFSPQLGWLRFPALSPRCPEAPGLPPPVPRAGCGAEGGCERGSAGQGRAAELPCACFTGSTAAGGRFAGVRGRLRGSSRMRYGRGEGGGACRRAAGPGQAQRGAGLALKGLSLLSGAGFAVRGQHSDVLWRFGLFFCCFGRPLRLGERRASGAGPPARRQVALEERGRRLPAPPGSRAPLGGACGRPATGMGSFRAARASLTGNSVPVQSARLGRCLLEIKHLRVWDFFPEGRRPQSPACAPWAAGLGLGSRPSVNAGLLL